MSQIGVQIVREEETGRPRHHFLVVSLIGLSVALAPIVVSAGIVDAFVHDDFSAVPFQLATYLWIFAIYMARDRLSTDALSWHFTGIILTLAIGTSWYYLNDPLAFTFLIISVPVSAILLGWRGAAFSFTVALVALTVLGFTHYATLPEFDVHYWVNTSVSCMVVGTIFGAVSARLHNAVRVIPDPVTIRDFERERELESQLMLAERDRALGGLARAVAHDFNNLLTPMLASAEMASWSVDDPEVREDLSAIMLAGNEAKELVRTVLEFQRDDSREEALGLGETVESIFDLLKHGAPGGVKIELEIERELRVYARRSDIQRVVMNLVTNARSAVGESGEIVVTVRAATFSAADDETVCISEIFDPEGRMALLEVRDDGAGIPPEIRDEIFEPFVTGAGGTGLGLATVREIVEDLSGGVCVSSEVGVGTRFRIYLPLVEAEASAA